MDLECSFTQMFPNTLNFNHQSKKVVVAVCGPHQFMINGRRNSQNHWDASCNF